MHNLVEAIATYVAETRKLDSLPSSTETSFYPDLKALLGVVLKSERLPFYVIVGTSESSDMPDYCANTCASSRSVHCEHGQCVFRGPLAYFGQVLSQPRYAEVGARYACKFNDSSGDVDLLRRSTVWCTMNLQ
jgi:hypothetical protein